MIFLNKNVIIFIYILLYFGGVQMTISVRLNDIEEEKLKELQSKTGLSVTALVKKGIFGINNNFNGSAVKELGRISTSINLTKNAIDRGDKGLATFHLLTVEKGVDTLWRSL